MAAEEVCNQLVTQYIQRKDQCDVNMKVKFYELVMDLVFNFKVLYEYECDNELALLNP